MSQVLQSFIGGRWIGQQAAQSLRSAVNGATVAQTHAEAIDFGDAVHYARTVGLPNLLKLDFQERAQRLKALAKYLGEHKETLYAISAHTGATRADSWVDIEGGAGTLFAYSSMGSNELPSGNLIHEGPAFPLGKKGGFAGTHILVPRGGIAVHINAFNFPIWGLLEKFAPSFLAGMPCIGKPATATSYLTEAMVRLVEQSGILPAGSLQLVIGSTGDLLDRLNGQDVVTFTGSADTAAKLRVHPNVVKHSIPFNAEADSLNCAILAPDVTPDDEEFDLFVKEVAREMSVKAGQKCTAIRRAIVPRQHLDAVAEKLKARLAKIVVGDPGVEGVKMGALASHAQQADVAERVALLRQSAELVFGGGADFAPVGEGVGNGAFFQPTLLLCQKPLQTDSVHDVEAFGPVSTLMPYDGIDEALQLAARGQGSLVGTLVTKDPQVAARVIPVAAALHGRLHILDREAAVQRGGHRDHAGGHLRVFRDQGADQAPLAARGQLQGFVDAVVGHERADGAEGFDVVHAVGLQRLLAQQQRGLEESAAFDALPDWLEIGTAAKHQLGVLAQQGYALGHIGLLGVRGQRAHLHALDRRIAHHHFGQAGFEALGHSVEVLARHDGAADRGALLAGLDGHLARHLFHEEVELSLIHISEPTRH